MKEQTTYAHDVRLACVELARTEHERAEHADAAHLYILTNQRRVHSRSQRARTDKPARRAGEHIHRLAKLRLSGARERALHDEVRDRVLRELEELRAQMYAEQERAHGRGRVREHGLERVRRGRVAQERGEVVRLGRRGGRTIRVRVCAGLFSGPGRRMSDDYVRAKDTSPSST
jgi:hypothetical protein